MSTFEKKKIEVELQKFTSQNFEQPSNCRNIDQILFYVRELCAKINEYEMRFNYVPSHAYWLLAQYNQAHTKMVYKHFVDHYS